MRIIVLCSNDINIFIITNKGVVNVMKKKIVKYVICFLVVLSVIMECRSVLKGDEVVEFTLQINDIDTYSYIFNTDV